ncbi:hypothetical protein SELMODRAFT_431735, partial [Selaginella moellendorffii]
PAADGTALARKARRGKTNSTSDEERCGCLLQRKSHILPCSQTCARRLLSIYISLLTLTRCRLDIQASVISSAPCEQVLNETTRVYDFQVVSLMVRQLGRTKNIITVNGKLPGPTIYANVGFHKYGIWQFRNPLFDSPAMSSQARLIVPLQLQHGFTHLLSMEPLTAQHERNKGRCGSQGPLHLQGDPWRKLYQSCSDSHFDLAVESFGDSAARQGVGKTSLHYALMGQDMEWHEGVSCGVGDIDVAGINLQKPLVAKDSELQQLQNKSQDCITLQNNEHQAV